MIPKPASLRLIQFTAKRILFLKFAMGQFLFDVLKSVVSTCQSRQSHGEAQTILKILHPRLWHKPVKVHLRVVSNKPRQSFRNASLKVVLGESRQ